MKQRSMVTWRRAVACGLLVATPIVAGCGGSTEPAVAQQVRRRPLPVAVVKVRRDTIRDVVYATGTSRAVKREYLYFESSGTVRFVKKGPGGRELREGDPVKKGEVIARLDLRDANANVAVAVSQLAEAKALSAHQAVEHHRSEALLKRKAVSQSEYDLSKTQLKVREEQVKSADARVAQAKLEIGHLTLESPIDGVIGYLNIREGYYFGSQSVQSQTEQQLLETVPCVVLDTSEFEITMDVPSSEAARVAPGQPVVIARDDRLVLARLRVDQVGSFEQIWMIFGTVFSVNPAVSPGGRSVQVKVRTSRELQLKPPPALAPPEDTPERCKARVAEFVSLKDGSYCTCWIFAQIKPGATILPYNCLMFEESRPYCFTVDPQTHRTTRRNLKLGIFALTEVEVLAEVKPGELAVGKGKHNLSSESVVEIITPEGGEPVQ